ncbi:hypothetical protein [Streptomyces sp. SID3343]|uniref:hypothetical protein n=1 Tax=Streptomyces sp. SID3343 TaxID=2690260 RepID=UPI001368BEAD|nr:hypothetical protein [Streptomyces sp. SID3343]MYW06670.1 hypothetical protein [Streptomyces sp. SID3343]
MTNLKRFSTAVPAEVGATAGLDERWRAGTYRREPDPTPLGRPRTSRLPGQAASSADAARYTAHDATDRAGHDLLADLYAEARRVPAGT